MKLENKILHVENIAPIKYFNRSTWCYTETPNPPKALAFKAEKQEPDYPEHPDYPEQPALLFLV